jgi:hypothetical protein
LQKNSVKKRVAPKRGLTFGRDFVKFNCRRQIIRLFFRADADKEDRRLRAALLFRRRLVFARITLPTSVALFALKRLYFRSKQANWTNGSDFSARDQEY